MKHVDRRHFFVRECVEEHKMRVPYVATGDNLADFLTKCQPPDLFYQDARHYHERASLTVLAYGRALWYISYSRPVLLAL